MLKGGKLFGESVPTQRHQDNPPSNQTIEYGGELRGFYPDSSSGLLPEQAVAKGTWFPLNSEKHDARKNGHRVHGGIDFYAPYTPFPYEIPVLALADGEVQFVYWPNTTNPIGNQANLYLTDKGGRFGKYIYRLIYGHLNRFRPVNAVKWSKDGNKPSVLYRSTNHRTLVKQGDIIGYIGISGNADTKGEATTLISPAGVSSCHIHLQLSQTVPARKETKEVKARKVKKYNLDPTPLLDFAIDDVKDLEDPKKPAKRPPAADWKTRNQGSEFRGEAKYVGTELKIASNSEKNSGITIPARKRVHPRKPNIAPWPFHGLNLDQYSLLTISRTAYRQIVKGLTGTIGPFTKLVLATQKTAFSPVSANESKTRVASSLQDLHTRALDAADPAEATNPHRAARVTAALMLLIEGQYALMGGLGFEVPGTQKSKYRSAFVRSGVGVQGRLYGMASVGKRDAVTNNTPELAIGYLHETWKAGKPGEKPVYAAFSVGFGSGSSQEATFNLAAVGSIQTVIDDTATPPQLKTALEKLHEYCLELVFCHIKLVATVGYAIRFRNRLVGTGDVSEAAWEQFCERVSEVADKQRKNANRYLAVGVTDKARQLLWLEIAKANLEIINITRKIARKPGRKQNSKETIAAQPDLRLLYSEVPIVAVEPVPEETT